MAAFSFQFLRARGKLKILSMNRLNQIVFIVSVVALCWFAMMAVHELGHVVGAMSTGGTVNRVVLHPLAISRTDVSPNPHPAIVVWAGPVLGCLLPLVIATMIPRRLEIQCSIGWFFAGFCLIANGAYISLGSFGRVGDCGEMLRTGTPLAIMLAFGLATVFPGLICWHRLGSVNHFLSSPSIVTRKMTAYAVVLLGTVLFFGLPFSPAN